MSVFAHYQAAFVATVVAAATIPLVHLAILRVVRRSELTTPLAFPCFALAFVVFFAVGWALGMPFDASRLLFGIGLLGFSCLGYLAVMFHLYRGFSNTLLCDVARLRGATLDDVLRQFAEGVGAEEMLQRRLRTMIAYGLIEREGQTVRLTVKGTRSARQSQWYKRIVHLGSGG